MLHYTLQSPGDVLVYIVSKFSSFQLWEKLADLSFILNLL